MQAVTTTTSDPTNMTFATTSEAINYFNTNPLDTNWWWYPSVTYTYQVYADKGVKAFAIVKALAEKKLVEIRTGKQFIDLMETILAAL